MMQWRWLWLMVGLVVAPLARGQEFTPPQRQWVQLQVDGMAGASRAYRRQVLAQRKLAWPETRDPEARAKLTAAAVELGLDPQRFVLTRATDEERTMGDAHGAFIYLSPDVVRQPTAWLQFTLAHEWAHVVQEHGLKHLSLMYTSAALACYTCVRKQSDAFSVALGFFAKYPTATHAFVKRNELEADAWATRYLAARGISMDHEARLLALHGTRNCLDLELGDHPSCMSRLKGVYRILALEYPTLLDERQKLEVFRTGAVEIDLNSPELIR